MVGIKLWDGRLVKLREHGVTCPGRVPELRTSGIVERVGSSGGDSRFHLFAHRQFRPLGSGRPLPLQSAGVPQLPFRF